ncbi:phosphatase PAP2 family protein [Cohnella hashimotonis]|uniref:Phosphatase PAP2 family protein n=1 Tax=Cohnella hashimotonis TaxID=2826895 RepID=A0ABT6TG00_9BACL|nr:phosphatase PAP2 family protein [Cohnella hashimotonis]MDI4645763.1 phosphatase PAP2 family protein [Cohnella hashimotonis]
MKFTLKLSAALLISILFAAGFGLIALLVGFHRLNAFDRSIIRFMQGFETPGLSQVMKFFTAIGAGLPVTAIAVAIAMLLFFVLKHRRELILFVFALAGSQLLNVVLKLAFHRERPDIHRIIQVSGYSFPSGHSMGAFSLYGISAYLLWKHVPAKWGRSVLIAASAALVLAIGVSRIYLGVHYPSDVLGGYLASAFWLASSIWVYRKYDKRRANRT